MFKLVYTLFEKKLKTLRKYLAKNEKKRIYKKISIIDRILNSLCTQKERNSLSIY